MRTKVLVVNPTLAMDIACGIKSSVIRKEDTDYRGPVAILSKISKGGLGTMPGYVNCLTKIIDVKKLDKIHYIYKLGKVDIIEPVYYGAVDNNLFDVDDNFNIMPDFDSEYEQELWEAEHFWKYINGAKRHYDDSWNIPEPCEVI